jgi:hypothetical protein
VNRNDWLERVEWPGRGARHLVLILVLLGLAGGRVDSRPSVWWRVEIGFGRGFGTPIWLAGDVLLAGRRWQKARDEALQTAEMNGRCDVPPPVRALPHWAQGQEIARGARADILLARMAIAGVKAAQGMMQGSHSHDREDRLEEGLPFGFSARDWGASILRDSRLFGRSKSAVQAILRHELARLRDLFTDLRDEVHRDVVWTHHAWERSRSAHDPKAASRAAWRYWHALGNPAL